MKKWFFSNRNNDISCTHHARGHATLRENIEKMCNLMRLGEKFSHVAYAPEPLAHMSANKLQLIFDQILY